MSDALIQYALEEKNIDGADAFISTLENNVSFGTPKELVELYLFASKHFSRKAKKRIGHEIEKQLEDKTTQEVMSNTLCQKIDEKEIDELIGVCADHFKPDEKFGGKIALKKAFLSSAKNFETYQAFKEAVKNQLKDTDHLDYVLSSFEKKKWVKKYYKEVLITKARIELKQFSYDCSEAIELLEGDSLKYKSISYVRNNEIWDALFTFAKSEKALFEKADRLDFRIELLEKLRKHKSDVWVEAFLSHFFPDLSRSDDEYKVLKELLREWNNEKRAYFSLEIKKANQLKGKYRIINAQEIYQTLVEKKAAIKKWTGQVFGEYSAFEARYLYEELDILYRVNYSLAQDCLKIESPEADFLSNFLKFWKINNHRHWSDKELQEHYLNRLRDKFPKLEDQAKVIQFIRSHPNVKEVFKGLKLKYGFTMFSLTKDLHEKLNSTAKVDLQARFIEGEQEDEFKKFISEIVYEVLIASDDLNYGKMKSIMKDFKVSSSLCFKAWRKLEKDAEFVASLKKELKDEEGTVVKHLKKSLSRAGFSFEDKSKWIDFVDFLKEKGNVDRSKLEKLQKVLLHTYSLDSFAFNTKDEYKEYREAEIQKFKKFIAEQEVSYEELLAVCRSESFQNLKKGAEKDFLQKLTFFETVVTQEASYYSRATTTTPTGEGEKCIVS